MSNPVEWPEDRRRLINLFLDNVAILEADSFRRREGIEESYLAGELTGRERNELLIKERELRLEIIYAMRDFIGLHEEEVPEGVV